MFLFKNVQRSIFIIIILMVVITFSTALFYWRETTIPRAIDMQTIGEALEISVTDLSPDNQTVRLVPKGRVVAQDDQDQIVFTYTVNIPYTLIQEAELHIWAHDVLIGESNQYQHLVDIEIMGDKDETVTSLSEVVLVTVIVRLIEPIDADEASRLGLDPDVVNVLDSESAYLAIRGETISFKLTFQLREKE